MNKLFDTFMTGAIWITPLGILLLLAVVIAVVILLIFRWTTNATLLDRRKNQMLAGLMEFHHFRADPWIALRALPRLLFAQARYLRALILPFLLSLIPVVWILIQAQYWVLHRLPQPRDQMICKITINLPPGQILETPFQLQFDTDTNQVNASLRIPEEQAVYWSVPLPPGPPPSQMILRGGGYAWKFPLDLTGNWCPLVSQWSPRTGISRFTNPRGSVLPAQGLLRSVELRYPDRAWRLAGINWNGGVLLMVASFLIAGLLKKPMKVNL